MTPERNLIEETAAKIACEVMGELLALVPEECSPDSLGAKLIREGIRRYAATPKSDPVLRWEELGYDEADLYLGEHCVAYVREGTRFHWTVVLGRQNGSEDTLTEARTAAEQAVRDWLKRAGCV